MLKAQKTAFLFFLLLVFLTDFSSAQKVPVESYLPFKDSSLTSSIHLPVRLPLEVIEKTINSQIKGLIFQEQEDNGFSYKVWKLDKIHLNAKDNSSNLETLSPLKIWVKGGVKTNVLGYELNPSLEQNFALKLKLLTKLKLNNKWQLESKTELIGYEWIETPGYSLGPVKLSLGFLVDKIIEWQKDALSKELDKELGKYFNFKGPANELWKIFQKPFTATIIDKDTLWMSSNVNALTVSPPVFLNREVKTSISVQPQLDLNWGKKPAFFNKNPLPNPQLKEVKNSDSKLMIKAVVTKDKMLEMVRKSAIGQKFEYNKYKASVSDLNIYGSENKIVIDVLMEGDIRGSLYVFGTPRYDKEKQTIILDDLNYKLAAKTRFPKFITWLFHQKIKNNIKTSFEQMIRDQLNFVRKSVEQSLKNMNINGNALLNGKINQFYFSNFILTKENFITFLTVDGSFNLLMTSLE